MEHSISQSRFISKTMFAMSLGVFITFLTGYLIESSGIMITRGMILITSLLSVVMAVALRPIAHKMSIGVASMWFVLYSIVNGAMFSVIFMAFDLGVIASVFLIAAIMFFCAAMVGMTIKKDLGVISRFLFMALIGLLVTSILSFFIPSLADSKFIGFIGVIVFSAYTAYDMQMVKNIHDNAYDMEPDYVNRFVIVAALELYLDFINLFLYLLRFAKKK